MAKCSKCRRRKGKRSCPALGSLLCPQCCGTLRTREIPCPPHCRYLIEHRPYQEKKVLKRNEARPGSGQSEDDLLKDERLAWLALHIEAPLKEMAERSRKFSDRNAILALEYAKDRMSQRRSILLLPGETREPANAEGETVFRSMENCRYERSVILAGAPEGYTAEEKTRVLDRLIAVAKSAARENFDGRAYLELLTEQFARLKDLSRQTKILVPR